MATTEQLMAQYGVAWFGFDEASGNVYDKLGNDYVGTATGATRTSGWNGKDSAMSFNGSNQYIDFNNKIISNGEKTIKFKFRHTIQPSNVNTAHMLLCTSSASGGHGIMVFINGATGFNVYFSSGSPIVVLTDINKFYNDGKWTEFHFNWDGQKDSIVYIKIGNDEYKFRAIGNESGNHSGNLRLGKPLSTATYYYNGQIDDLQIYNKVLFPSDFDQKRLAVKSESNKNLVLSPTSTRVKEIPNTNENTLLAQGGVIHEIDSAIDRPPIDLTRVSTEYEIVNNNKSPLGAGNLFTIPISNNFKTAFIEDND
ncbi:LamG-like jellyroll fold domain-containing protein [Metasolibacillus meyeri]|uniref:LamG-like jellyroll fold domain-containing protein n=1 Tax=Metasolibacillus meyeri TaxID=1071052 RepID=UPI000D31B720|nr:LamG-like jellyroll fold domain-containing protein [Metasolibacillus meyeri]